MPLAARSRMALCGGWDHPPPCPLAPHYVTNVPNGETVTLRVVFATEPANEQRVRSLIGETLAAGELTVPDGGVAHWQLRSASPGNVRADEEDLAAAADRTLTRPWCLSAPEGIRTPNLLIRSQMLYPLSYGRLCSIVSGGGGERI